MYEYDEEIDYDEKWKRTFSSMLQFQMNEKSISQHELSRKTGLSAGTINKYLTRKSVPTVVNAIKIAKALHCSLEDIGVFII